MTPALLIRLHGSLYRQVPAVSESCDGCALSDNDRMEATIACRMCAMDKRFVAAKEAAPNEPIVEIPCRMERRA